MSDESNIDSYRRRFLGGTTAAVAGLGIAPGVLLHEVAMPGQPTRPSPARCAGAC